MGTAMFIQWYTQNITLPSHGEGLAYNKIFVCPLLCEKGVIYCVHHEVYT